MPSHEGKTKVIHISNGKYIPPVDNLISRIQDFPNSIEKQKLRLNLKQKLDLGWQLDSKNRLCNCYQCPYICKSNTSTTCTNISFTSMLKAVTSIRWYVIQMNKIYRRATCIVHKNKIYMLPFQCSIYQFLISFPHLWTCLCKQSTDNILLYHNKEIQIKSFLILFYYNII